MNKIKQVVAAAALFGCMCGIAGTVTVEGKGSVTRHPDGMQLKITVDALDKDMAKSKTMLAEKHAKIKEVLVGVGVSEDELFDSNIQMYPEYHREDREGNDLSDYAGRGKRVFDGYRHVMKCEFKSKLDLERLEKIYAAVVRTKCVEDLQIDFYLMDPKPAKAEARRLAVVNARTVADELCKAASATLGGVAEINYNARNYISEACCAEMKADDLAPQEDDAPLFPSIDVEDIEVADEVVVKWEIK